MSGNDPDSELDAWYLANAEAFGRRSTEEAAHHRCQPDMPPCPNCQELYDRESEDME